jgi:hypothetical protein
LRLFRYEKENGGITVGEAEIDTDRNSRAMLHAAKYGFDKELATSVHWKAKSGFVTLTSEQIMAISQAVFAHVQACFAAEAAHNAAIDAVTDVAELAAYDVTTGWPV